MDLENLLKEKIQVSNKSSHLKYLEFKMQGDAHFSGLLFASQNTNLLLPAHCAVGKHKRLESPLRFSTLSLYN